MGALTAAGLLTVGCQPAEPEAQPPATEVPPTEAPTAEEPVKIVFWHEAQVEQKEVIEQEYVETFQDAHPGVELEVIFQEDLDRVVRTALQAGAGPDLVRTPGAGFVLEYINAGHILDVTGYADQYNWNEKLLSWAYAAGTVGGKLYSLPHTYESLIVFSNQTVFDGQDWGIPTNRQELESICEEAMAADIVPLANNNGGFERATEWYISMFLDAYAGPDSVYKALIGEKPWTDEEFVGAMALFNDWVQAGWMFGGVDGYHAFTGEDTFAYLSTGRAAMAMNGTWALPGVEDFEETGQDWAWFVLPPLREGLKPVFSLATGGTVSVNAESEHPNEAAAAIDWMYGDKARALRIASAFGFGQWMVPLKYTTATTDTPRGLSGQPRPSCTCTRGSMKS
jgi:raffinose/stachyose/melibiose transport system substrate-binding protein